MNAQRIIDRFEYVRTTGDRQWIARCPAHDDRTPSLSIRVTDDGRVLIHDFGGCETSAVLLAIGLTFADLYSKPLAHYLPPLRGGFSARELLELTAHEATVATLLATTAQSRPLTSDETERLIQAAGRLVKVQGLANGR